MTEVLAPKAKPVEVAEVIARLQRATLPDRTLDEAMAYALGWRSRIEDPKQPPWWCPPHITDESPTAWLYDILPWTGRTDLALALIPERWAIWLKRRGGHHWTCELHVPSSEIYGRHALLPIAICIAVLHAKVGDTNG